MEKNSIKKLYGKNRTKSIRRFLPFASIASGVFLLLSIGYSILHSPFSILPTASAFTGPTSGAGVGGGAFGLNAANNVSIGTSTPAADTKLLVVSSSTDSSNFALRILQSNGGPIMVLRNDGVIGVGTASPSASYLLDVNGNTRVTGTFSATSYTGTVAAANVSAGVMGANIGQSPYAFPASLGVATSTQVSLPQSLSVYGGGYFSGSVGIGQTNPSVPLDINKALGAGDQDTGNFFNSTGNGYVLVGTSNANSHNLVTGYDDSNNYGFFRIGGDAAGTGVSVKDGGSVGIGTSNPLQKFVVSNAGAEGLEVAPSGGNVLVQSYNRSGAAYTPLQMSGSNLQFQIGGVTKIYIDSSGNLGVGTSSPAYTLDVAGTGRFTQPLIVGTPTASNHAATKAYVDTAVGGGGGAGSFTTLTATATSTFATSGGNVGIGTATPGTKLDVYNLANGPALRVGSASLVADNVASLDLYASNGAAVPAYARVGMGVVTGGVGSETGFLTLSTINSGSLTEKMRVLANGNVGIGTTTPQMLLSVAKNAADSVPAFEASNLNASGYAVAQINRSNTLRSAQISFATAGTGDWQMGTLYNGGGPNSGFSIQATNGVVAIGSTVPAFHITTTGNVGIGTASPASKLDVAGSINLSGVTSSTIFYGTTGVAAPAGGSAGEKIQLYGTAGTVGSQDFALGIESGYMWSNVQSGAGYKWYINSVAKEVMDGSGNVGIATTSPAYTLDVVGTGRFTQPLVVGTPTQGSHAATKSYVDTAVGGGGGAGSFTTLTATATSSFATSGGYVGIGRAPLAGLDVYHRNILISGADTAGALLFERGDAPTLPASQAGIWLQHNGGLAGNDEALIFNNADTSIDYRFKANSTDRMVIDGGTGNVGIGTTGPTAKLDVSGSLTPAVFISSTNYPSTYHTQLGAQSGAQGILVLGNNGTNEIRFGSTNVGGAGYVYVNNTADYNVAASGTLAMVFAANGSIGIGAAPSYKLDVQGTGSFSQPVIVGTPTAGNNAATKSYVDTAIGGGGGAGSFSTLSSTATSTFATSGGNVGIGTASPSYKFQVHQATDQNFNTYGNFSLADGVMLQSVNDAANAIKGLELRGSAVRLTDSTGYMVLTGGNVGIGTTGPQQKLDVRGGLATSISDTQVVGKLYSSAGDGYLELYTGDVTPTSRIRLSAFGNSYLAASGSGNVGIGTTSPLSLLHVHGATDSNFRVRSDYATWGAPVGIVLQSANDADNAYKAMTFAGSSYYFYSGNVGIGTSSPAFGLDVVGTARFSQPVVVGTPTASNHAATKSYVDTAVGGGGGAGSFSTLSSTATSTFATSGGNVGIGTASPGYKLQVSGNSSPAIAVTATNVPVTATLQTDDAAGYLSTATNHPLVLRTNNTEQMRILTNGNVGIGTSTPAYSLAISNTVSNKLLLAGGAIQNGMTFDAVAGADQFYLYTGTPTLSGFSIYDNTAALTRFFIANSGNVGIGTTGPAAKLDVNGTTELESNLYMNAGSAATPSVVSFNDTGSDTGIFWPGTPSGNNLAISTAGTERLRVDGSGNVGIGNASPDYPVDVGVKGGTQTATAGSSGAYRNARAADSSPYTQSRIIVYGGPNIDMTNWGYLGYGSDAVMRIIYGKNTNGGLAIGQSSAIDGSGSVTNRMYFDNNGNVGIGTSGPGYKLDVQGTGNFSQPVIVGTPTAGNHAATKSYVDTAIGGGGGAGSFSTLSSTATSTFATSGGNVGIGTTGPNFPLEIAGGAVNTYQNITSAGTANDVGIQFTRLNGDTSNGGATRKTWYMYNNHSGRFTLAQYYPGSSINAERMVIDEAGNVGIGTTSPGTKLDVAGDIRTNGGSLYVNALRFNSDSDVYLRSYSSNNSNGGYELMTNNGSRFGYLYGDTSGIGILNGLGQWVVRSTNALGATNTDISFSVGNTQYAQLTSSGLSVTGNGSFTQPVTVGTPTTGSHAATKSYVDTAVSGGVSASTNFVNGPDGDRNAATKLPTTSPHGVRFDFVNAGTANGGGNYSGLMTYAPWDGTSASTGDASYQVSFDSPSPNGGGVPYLSIRSGINSTWNTWYTMLNSGNYGNYALPLGGGTMSGNIQMGSGGNIYLNNSTTYGFKSQDAYIDTLSTGATNDPLEINYRVAGPTKICASVNCATYSAYFDQSGNVGIGTTTSTTPLEVNGAIRTTSINQSIGARYTSGSDSYLTSINWNSSAGGVLTLGNNGTNEIRAGRTATGGYLNFIVNNTAADTAANNGTLAMSLSSGGDLNLNSHNITAVNKLTVATVDPLYNIGGEKYATFASAIAGGVKEEYVGRGALSRSETVRSNTRNSANSYEYIVDFDKVPEGSDLWVWRKAVDFSKDNVEVTATPYGQSANIYYLIEGNKIIFRADSPDLRTSSQSIEFSFRLTGKRFDWKNWPTKAKDQAEQASFIVP